MPAFTYLIIGGGMTADAAAQAIREIDSAGSIGIITRERHAPYNRPPLSKGLWKGDSMDSIWRGTESRNVVLHVGHDIVALDVNAKSATDSDGVVFTYEKLLLATGGTPRHLPFGDERIIYFRTLDDYNLLRGITEARDRFVVIGGGFIGSEIAAALAMNGKKVTMVFPEKGIGARVFTEDMSLYLNEFYHKNGIEVYPGETVSSVTGKDGASLVQTAGGREFPTDCIIAGIGVTPSISLAQSAGLHCDNGILVDEFCKTTAPDVYAAGDVAIFYSAALQTRIRVEHEDNANTMGAFAGKAMAGKPEPYTHIPSFYSDLFDLGYEAAGEIDSRLDTYADWKEQYREGVVYYLKEGRVRGVLLVNTWGQIDNARNLILEKGPFTHESLMGKL